MHEIQDVHTAHEKYMKAWNAERERRELADRLAKDSGGVEKWFSSMSESERRKWKDLKEELLKDEQRRRRVVEALQRVATVVSQPLTLSERT